MSAHPVSRFVPPARGEPITDRTVAAVLEAWDDFRHDRANMHQEELLAVCIGPLLDEVARHRNAVNSSLELTPALSNVIPLTGPEAGQ